MERNFVIVTEDEILGDVELRQRPALAVVHEIDPCAVGRGIVDGLAVRIGRQERQVGSAPLDGHFQGVVVRVCGIGSIGVAAEIGPERTARSVDDRAIRPRVDTQLTARSTLRRTRQDSASTQAEAKRGIAGIRLALRDQLVALRPHIGQRERCRSAQLPLDTEVVMLGVGYRVVNVVTG